MRLSTPPLMLAATLLLPISASAQSLTDDVAPAERDLTETATATTRSGPILGAAQPARQPRDETWDAWGRA